MDYFNSKTWETWTNNNYDEFESLKDGAKIAILLPNTDNLIVIEKLNKTSVEIDDRNSFEFPFAEIAFKFGENTVDKVLSDPTFETLKKLTLSDEIGVMPFVKQDKLIRYDYETFLKKFGFKINSSCSCGCC